MKSGLKTSTRAALVIASLLASGSVFAQATRTWVSGVGDDANPCSRTAPCKTYAGAISKTAANGEISTLDPGGFGAVTITKSITINGDGTLAGILSAGTTGVIVNGAGIKVTLRNLSINGGGTGLNGIRFLNGASLNVENVTITGINTGFGIDASNTASGELSVINTTISNTASASGGGVLLKPAAGISLTAHFDNVRLINNDVGMRVEDRVNASFVGGFVAGSASSGLNLVTTTNPAQLTVHGSTITGNAPGVTSGGIKSVGANSTVIISNNIITANGTGLLSSSSGVIRSIGGNTVSGNGTNGAPTTTSPAL